MKKLLPLLICYVLMQSQCFAIPGGPDYGRNGNINTIGSYSGTIQGVTETDLTAAASTPPLIPGDPVPGDPGTGTGTTASSNALGLFDLVVPGTVTATGGFLLFADGVVFGGTISASVDPDTARLSGILQASYTITATSTVVIDPIFGTSTGTTTTVAGQALGMISAKIAAGGTHAATAARLNGTANLAINFGVLNATTNEPVVDRTITFTVTGFQTTASITTSSTIGTAASTTSTAGQTN